MSKFSKKVEKFYSSYWREYVARCEKSPKENKIIRTSVLKMLGNLSGKKLLDIGCGDGAYVVEYTKRGAHVTATDISKELFAIARKRCIGLNVRFLKGDILTMKLPQERFDIISCILVTGHIADLDRLFKRIRKLLKSNGAAVVTFSHPLRGRYIDPGRNKGINHRELHKARELLSDWGDGILAPVIKRPLSECFAPMFRAGFSVTSIKEPSVLLVKAQLLHNRQ